MLTMDSQTHALDALIDDPPLSVNHYLDLYKRNGFTETGAVANFLSPSAWSPGGQPANSDIFVYIAPAVTT